jgi:hypothetical protein
MFYDIFILWGFLLFWQYYESMAVAMYLTLLYRILGLSPAFRDEILGLPPF